METERKLLNANVAYSQGISGRGVTVAFLDTGVSPVADIRGRVLAFVDMVNGKKNPYDDNGHGTHGCGIACGNGALSNGKYMGIAPESNIVSVKVLDKKGEGSSAHVLAGLQWVIDNQKEYDIRIINLSIGAPRSNSQDPLVKAVEAFWDAGILVVVAAGNNGPNPGSITSPGISRKIITVGAADDNQQLEIWGSQMVHFSGRGPTAECIVKPDLLAPGANIISCLGVEFRDQDIVDKHYLKLSGTSMATPMISGALALLLQKHPNIDPNTAKYLLKQSCSSLGFPGNHQGWGLLDIGKLMEVV